MKFFSKNIIKFTSLIFLFIVFSIPLLSLAQAGTNPPDFNNSNGTNPPVITSAKILNPISVNNINDFIKIILQGAIKIGIPIIALAIIYSGFLFVQARGNPEAIKEAKSALMYTLIGAAILLGAWAIAQLISNTILAL